MSLSRLHYIQNQNHQFIIDTMKKMNMSPNEQGMCAGLIATTECAYLAGNKESFDEIIDKIYNQSDDLPLLAQDLFENYSLNELLSPDFFWEILNDTDRLTYQAIKLFHYIDCYQNPGRYITNTLQNQFITDEIDNLISSEMMPDSSAHFRKLSYWPGIYKLEEFYGYLNIFFSNVTKNTPNFVVRFDTVNHRVSLFYDKFQGWFLLDPNYMPGFPLKDVKVEEIANKIFQAFRVQGNVLAVETVIRGISTDSPQIEAMIDKIQNNTFFTEIHEVTVERINLQDYMGVCLSHIAAQNNAILTLRKIKLLGDINPPMHIGWTPLQIAAQEGFDEVIKLFSEFKEYESDLADAVPYAIMNERYDLLAVFKEANVDFAHKDTKGISYCFEAVICQNSAMIEKLASLGAPLNIPAADGITPIMYAAHEGLSECVEKLGSLGVDTLQSTADGKTLAQLAVENGHLNVLKVLFKKGWAKPSLSLKEFARMVGQHEIERFIEKKIQKNLLLFQKNTDEVNKTTAMVKPSELSSGLINRKKEGK